MSLTTDPKDPDLRRGIDQEVVPQSKKYLVLSQEELAKGFIRPVRDKYVHVGRRIEKKGEIVSLEEGTQNLSDWGKSHYTKENGYGAFLKYPESESPVVGTFLKQDELDAIQNAKENVGGCGVETKMNWTISETYARDPKFYGATYCVGCQKHLPVEEFQWSADGEVVGS